MLKHRGQSMTKEAKEVLNVLYVYDRSYQPYYINWLYPLQLALQDKNPSSGESAGLLYNTLSSPIQYKRPHQYVVWVYMRVKFFFCLIELATPIYVF